MVRLYGILWASTFWSTTMPKFIDRIGQRFGRLVITAPAGRDRNKKVLWTCLCDCGQAITVPSGSLVTRNTESCGCLFKERVTKHGGWKNSSYNTWRAMMRRCYNLKDKDYLRYGGLGVLVCDRWHEYLVFAGDMGEPNGDETLDRRNPYGGYSPENCRWAGIAVQSRNTRLRANSVTGVTGVSKTPNGKFMAKVTVQKSAFYSKCYVTIAEATAARKELERKHWGTV